MYLDFKVLLANGSNGYLLLLGILLAAGLGLPLPEDIPLVTAGYMVHVGKFSMAMAIAVSMVGVLGGDSLAFAGGWRFGRRGGDGRRSLMERLAGEKNPKRVQRYFERYGNRTLFIARFLPGLRAATYFTAGASGVQFWTFLLVDGLAAMVSVPVWILLGWYFGPEVDRVLRRVQKGERVLLYVILAVVAVIGGKLLWGWWRRRRARQR